jgi:hypothetical protein
MRSCPRALGVAASFSIVIACGSQPRSAAERPRASADTIDAGAARTNTTPDTDAAAEANDTTPARCRRGPTPERVEVELGRTVITKSGVAVTFRTTSHDNYDDGRTDLLLHLVFQGVSEDGKLTPSALSWLPSAFAKPVWTYLHVNRCVRVVEPGERRVVLELFTPGSTEP